MSKKKVISREEARAKGMTFFFNGESCVHGHKADRYVISGACVKCQKIRNNRFIKLNGSPRDRAFRKKYQTLYQNAGPPIVTLDEARTKGLKMYYTGKPCSKGHFAERDTLSRHCVECERKPKIEETEGLFEDIKKRFKLKEKK